MAACSSGGQITPAARQAATKRAESATSRRFRGISNARQERSRRRDWRARALWDLWKLARQAMCDRTAGFKNSHGNAQELSGSSRLFPLAYYRFLTSGGLCLRGFD